MIYEKDHRRRYYNFFPDEKKLVSTGIRKIELVLNSPASRLLYLLLSNGSAITHHDEILQEVWGKYGQYVTLNTLYQNISILRKSLSKMGGSTSSIRTHSKVGFSFQGKVHNVDEPQGTVACLAEIGENNCVNEAENRSIEPICKTDTVRVSMPVSGKFVTSYPDKSKMKTILVFVVFVFIPIIAYLLGSINPVQKFKNKFNTTHIIAARVNNCPLYIDHENRQKNLEMIIGYLKDHHATCKQNEFMYLTKAIHRQNYYLFTCSPDGQKGLQCITEYILPGYLHDT